MIGFERTVPFPSEDDFGTNSPALIVYGDDGTPIDVVFGKDIQPYLEAVHAAVREVIEDE